MDQGSTTLEVSCGGSDAGQWPEDLLLFHPHLQAKRRSLLAGSSEMQHVRTH